jgi:hypothetical protein
MIKASDIKLQSQNINGKSIMKKSSTNVIGNFMRDSINGTKELFTEESIPLKRLLTCKDGKSMA